VRGETAEVWVVEFETSEVHVKGGEKENQNSEVSWLDESMRSVFQFALSYHGLRKSEWWRFGLTPI